MFSDWELEERANKIEELRQKIKNNSKYLDYYNYLKEYNKGDIMYGWLFTNNDMLEEDLLELSTMYQKGYVKDVMNCYIGELETIIYRVDLS